MEICISHRTALAMLLRIPNPRAGRRRPCRATSLPTRLPSPDTVAQLKESLRLDLPEGHESLDLLVGRAQSRHKTTGTNVHLCSANLPEGSFIPMRAYGIDYHLSAPELVFLQMAETLDERGLIYVGSALCSDFLIDDLMVGGVDQRSSCGGPLTSRSAILSYLSRLHGVRNVRRARAAASHIVENARSPMEIGIALAIALPCDLGGYAIGSVSLNSRVRVYDGTDTRGNSRYSDRYPDILVCARSQGEDLYLDVEYDADTTHASADRANSDSVRRGLIAAGTNLRQIDIRTKQTALYSDFCDVMDRIRRILKQRKKPQVDGSIDSPANQRRLARIENERALLWSELISRERLRL